MENKQIGLYDYDDIMKIEDPETLKSLLLQILNLCLQTKNTPYMHVSNDGTELSLGSEPLDLYFFDSTNWKNTLIERGTLRGTRTFYSIFDVVQNILDNWIHSIAFSYELSHRIRYQDSRRVAFYKYNELCLSVPLKYRPIVYDLKNMTFNDDPRLDLIEDFERYSMILYKYKTQLTYRVQEIIAYFINQAYRERSRGIADFDNAFEVISNNFIELYNQTDIVRIVPSQKISKEFTNSYEVLKNYIRDSRIKNYSSSK
ncbi:hypothetical protein OGZ37_09545 [Lactococcus lactis]|uniref:Imm63 family immunity protein n=1 Tax=Lactococcus lactis TaxID=1358 RepID=UPI0024182BBD|nr:Imm63 family immunity protein [Lactococcus lactis]MDG4966814.1 hypothetical protein [Lactococcus lactis]